MEPDPFSARCESLRYPVSTTYLDTASLTCLEGNIQGFKNRFKLRIRTYGGGPEEPAFFEVKKRIGVLVRKSRAAVGASAVEPLLQGRPDLARSVSGSSIPDFLEFLAISRQAQWRSVVGVHYLREAYVSRAADPVRVNFDSELKYVPTRGLLAPNYDKSSDWSDIPVSGTVLEIKFTNRCPSWVLDLIRRFQLQQRSVSKFALSMLDHIEHHGRGDLVHAFRVPPRASTGAPPHG